MEEAGALIELRLEIPSLKVPRGVSEIAWEGL